MLRILKAFAFLTLGFIGSAFACSCSVAGTVDIAFASTPNVVVMKLRSVEKLVKEETGYGLDGIKSSTLTVEKSFKGNLKVGQELNFAQGGGGDCVGTFGEYGVGQEYLLYLNDKPSKGNLWVAGTCTRSNNVKYAASDLLYLENRNKAAGKTRLSGTISKDVESALEDDDRSAELLPDWPVSITGNGKTTELRTDKNGVFEVYGLAPGRYRVRIKRIPGFKTWAIDKESNEITVPAKGHIERNITFTIDNAIRGRFYDANGKALKDVCVELVPARGVAVRSFHKFDCTEPDGSFEIEEIPSGSYLLLFNDNDKITAQTPFGAFFYPKAKRREDAVEIQVEAGTFIENLTIVAPDTAEVITVSGTLKMADGAIANSKTLEYSSIEFITDEDVEKEGDKAEPASHTTVDAKGRFAIRILKGQRGGLYGTFNTFSGDFVNCPQVEKLIVDKEGVGLTEIKTPRVSINASDDQTDIVLTFPVPSCKKAKRE